MSNGIEQGQKWMDERQIIQRCQNNDVKAFQMIYERYGQALLHTAQRILKRRQDAEDAVQVAFVKLYRGIHRYHFGSPFSTYLFRILINVCYDMLRKSKRAGEESLENREPSELSQHQEKMEMERAVDSLPPKMRTCFVLFAVEQFKMKEIAEILRISEGGVKANIHHARTKLRKMLAGEGEEVGA